MVTFDNHPAFAQGFEFRAQMIEYIRTHFADLLGDHQALLDEEDGLDQLSDLLRRGAIGKNR